MIIDELSSIRAAIIQQQEVVKEFEEVIVLPFRVRQLNYFKGCIYRYAAGDVAIHFTACLNWKTDCKK